VNNQEFAAHIEVIRTKLYKTAYLYLGSQALALDAVDEAVYKALCSYHRLRQPEYFDTWIMRILINECCSEIRRQKRICPVEELPSSFIEEVPLADYHEKEVWVAPQFSHEWTAEEPVEVVICGAE